MVLMLQLAVLQCDPAQQRLGGCSVAEFAGTEPQSTGFLQLGSCREMFVIALTGYSVG